MEAQEVRAYLSADSVKVGERFALSLVADHNFMMQARFPRARADSGTADRMLGDLVVLARRDSSHRYLGRAGIRRDSVVYEVTTFALDTARVPPLPIAFVQDRDTVEATTAERLLPVQSVLSPGVRAGRDSVRLEALTPPTAFPRPLWPWLLLGTGVVTLATLLGYLFWRRRYGQEDEALSSAPPRPPVPPAEAARRRLRRLEETTDLQDPDAAKPFYTDLAYTLRRYLMHRLGLHAFRSTTPEVVDQLHRRTAPPERDAQARSLRATAPRGHLLPRTAFEQIRRVLERADLAKFADQRPSADLRRQALADTRSAIDAIEEALHVPERPSDGEANATGVANASFPPPKPTEAET